MFDGFSQESLDFLWGVRFNNERGWFEAHKEQYLNTVYTPMRELGVQLQAAMAQQFPHDALNLKVSRIYRDARRLHGRGPYKDHLWFILRRPEDPEVDLPCFYFELAPEYYSCGLGFYCARPVTMAKFRARMDADPAPMEKLARRQRRMKDFKLEGERYARPKGDPGPLLEPWYNRRSISLCCDRNPDELLFRPELAEFVLEGFRQLMPFHRYLSTLYADPEPGRT